jgi:hypothetical protein
LLLKTADRTPRHFGVDFRDLPENLSMKRHMYRVALTGLASAALSVLSSSASAELTDVIANRFGQPDPRQIVSSVFGQTVTAAGADFSGGSITATRIGDDSPSEELVGQKFVATAVARYSDYTQSYGVISSGSFTPVFEATGFGTDVSGSGTIKVNTGESFGRSGNSGTQSSTASENADGRDHVVTYRINGAKPDPQYLQFWEDLNKTPDLAKGRTISDFNDLVVKLAPASSSGGGGVGATVPLPPAIVSGGLVGVASFLIGRRRYS